MGEPVAFSDDNAQSLISIPETGTPTGAGSFAPDTTPRVKEKPKDPKTGAAIGLTGLLFSGLGSMFRAGAEAQQGREAKSAADLSAQFSQQAAADAVQRGLLREMEVTQRGDRVIAAQRVESSHGNLDVNVGAQQATEAGSQASLEFDRALVRRNAAMEAYGLRARAQAQYQEGEYAEEAGNARALGTFLGGMAEFVQGAGGLAADFA